MSRGGHFDTHWGGGGGVRKYYRDKRDFLSKIHKHFNTLWSSVIKGGEGERLPFPLVFATVNERFNLRSRISRTCVTKAKQITKEKIENYVLPCFSEKLVEFIGFTCEGKTQLIIEILSSRFLFKFVFSFLLNNISNKQNEKKTRYGYKN